MIEMAVVVGFKEEKDKSGAVKIDEDGVST